ncbi:COP1-interacting protein 7 isoform X1 [Selaginella moellendorffii]|nr:COP1-interacting protein 7 isoform X1 [Selaginella moellendorffii]XP_024543774.1 COP1-interacting protein 7 isoform X1 [Selaginella moellendorffii]XP_024543775.1 COP1-interacting protein 7 isoform X1 [Selaginella moellendorffii]|eukprot:XP_002983080.2 COP1-interacting protein 7 isoform X1 [Selaginella moellendorffii]
MKADIVLDFAVFQLTPTRTRCELLISSHGVSEKLASGLLKPFLAHLRAAEEQIAVGGYSIRLEPPIDGNQGKASWFTKGTMQRFVRFVSTPEVLERVSVVETELIQLEEELCNYTNEGDDQQSVAGSVATVSGGGKSFNKQSKVRKDVEEVDAENNETSRCRLIKAMETRHAVLQREQGMAFARAVAAGFDMDHLSDLLAFAEYFGAARLSEACHKFASLCKKQQEGGLWLDEMELVAAEGAYAYPEANGTGITIAPEGLAPLKNMIEASKAHDEKGTDDTARKDPLENLQRQPSGYLSDQHHNFPQMMGMPPYGHPPPWMHFGSEQGYDPRFMPQNPYVNGNYGQMNPYWAVPPPGTFNNASTNGEAEEEEDEVAEKSNGKKNSRKSSPRRRTSSPLKKVQVGRPGKRSGMVLIRNINYITGSQDQPAGGNKSRSTENESDESSEFETSSEIDQGGKQHYSEERPSRNKKKTRRQKSVPVVTEISSEGSHASANGKDTIDDTYFSVPGRGGLQSGGNAYAFDSEALPQQHDRRRSEFTSDDSYMLNGDGRAHGRNTGSQYGAEDQMKSSNLASKDGLVLPGRNQAGRFVSSNHDSELSFRKAGQHDGNLDDSFIIPQRSGFSDSAHPIDESYQHQNRQDDSKDTSSDAVLQDLFIVPSRPALDTSEVTRRTLELEMPADQLYVETKEKPESPKFEPEDIWMLPERSVGKESLEKRWSDVNVEMEAMSAMQPKPEPTPEEEVEEEFYEQYHEQRDAKLTKEAGPKKAEREARLKSLQDTLDKRKAELSSRFKATRSSILKTKREKEEAERKRLEEIAAERRNRIAARTGGTSTPKSQPAVSKVSRTSTTSKPPTRALSSTTTNKSSSVKKPASSSNPLSRSVPSLADVRKENAKPPAVRQQGATGKAGESSSAKKPTPVTRKSVASVRELVKPETQKASTNRAGSSLSQTDSRSASSRSLKGVPSTPAPAASSQEKAKVSGNAPPGVTSSISLNPNESSSSSHLQQVSTKSAERVASPGLSTETLEKADELHYGSSGISLEVPQIEAVSFEQTKDIPEVKMVANSRHAKDDDSSVPAVEPPGDKGSSRETLSPVQPTQVTQIRDAKEVGSSEAVEAVEAQIKVSQVRDASSRQTKEVGSGEAVEAVEAQIKVTSSQVEPVSQIKAASSQDGEAASSKVGDVSQIKATSSKVMEPVSQMKVASSQQEIKAASFQPRVEGMVAAKPIPPDVEVIYVPHKMKNKDSGLKKLLKIGRSLVRN